MHYLVALVLLLTGCGVVGPYCNRWETVDERPAKPQIRQVCREWHR